ncbi:hypothetical protein SELMODRAFT_272226 [Selaginella moellendorffii]|uniref:Myb-like domain-containing protein n=1 Tax=Selaginella moellendorffii TaxID=88036 RepID=D8T7T8_SELML|nr:SWR1-complex protein 4 [Selaginella moellendorffii]XP_024521238.1 SWR1-complex protein 4 [Selaginella moellendorffii]EFJ07255.1 hypothetical protein SELMODRAFT_272226 [Selaginella moellendorffii]|eukprot:XP_002991684.1 SWR1-complex protein 4 [Selaginella moellendorffii]
MDAKDILGLPKGGPVGDKRVRAPKETVPKKLDRVSREVYALTGGLPPLIASVDTKQRQASSQKISWQWLPFANSARTDGLQLSHWVRVVDSVVPTGDYAFAKYNRSVAVLKYTDDEYNKHLADTKWTKQETDLLFSMCEQFDLRFVIIADRFSPPRTVEELKDRYYSASKAIILSRATTPEEVADHPHVKDAYNFNYETERKRALGLLLSQSRQQEREDAEVLAEAKRITEARLSKVDEQAEQPSAPGTDLTQPSTDTAAAATSTTTTTRGHRVFLRGPNLGQMVQSMLSSVGARIVKRIEQILLDELGVRLEPKIPTESICREHLELRREVLNLVNLQKAVQWNEATVSFMRETHPEVSTPNTPKRGFRGGDRAAAVSGERIGKRDHKRKAPARFSDTPPSPPQQKRARKLKSES